VAEVLTKDEELFFDAVVFVLEKLDVVDTLLELLILLLLECVDVEDEKMAIVAAAPG
jgi:hypothetical protein